MSDNDFSHKEYEEPNLERVGQLLVKARETKGLTRQDIARELRLHVTTIESLEEGKIEQLPSPTFVMGYLRSYARLVDLPSEKVNLFTARDLEKMAQLRGAALAGSKKSGRNDMTMRIVSYLVIIVLFTFAAFWWVSRQPQSMSKAESETVTPEQAEQVMPASDPLRPFQQSSSEYSSNESDDTALDSRNATDTALEVPAAESNSDMTYTETVLSAGEESASATDSTELTSEEMDAAPEPEVAVVPEIRLVYTEDSWTEIHDATGKRLMFGIIKNGTERVLQGKAPFRLFFGFADGVEVYYKGERIDHSQYNRKGMARFELGEDSDN